MLCLDNLDVKGGDWKVFAGFALKRSSEYDAIYEPFNTFTIV